MIILRIVVGWASLLVTLGLLPASAATVSAAPAATTSGSRIVVTFTGKQPSKATARVAGKTYRLTKVKAGWRSKPLTADALRAAQGKRATVRATISGKKRSFTVRIKAPGATPTPPTSPTTPTTPAAPLFAAPGIDRAGNAAWEAIKGYFLDSTFTSCRDGWPACFSEERYGHFTDFRQTYCRLTSAQGADIINPPKPLFVTGAEQKANGAWGVSYDLDYGDGIPRQYVWQVQPDGSVSGLYSYNGGPAEQITGLIYLDTAKNCSF